MAEFNNASLDPAVVQRAIDEGLLTADDVEKARAAGIDIGEGTTRLFRAEGADLGGPRAAGEDALSGRWFSDSEDYVKELVGDGAKVSHLDVPNSVLGATNANWHRAGSREAYDAAIAEAMPQLDAAHAAGQITDEQLAAGKRAASYSEYVLPREMADLATPIDQPAGVAAAGDIAELEKKTAFEVRDATRKRFMAEGGYSLDDIVGAMPHLDPALDPKFGPEPVIPVAETPKVTPKKTKGGFIKGADGSLLTPEAHAAEVARVTKVTEEAAEVVKPSLLDNFAALSPKAKGGILGAGVAIGAMALFGGKKKKSAPPQAAIAGGVAPTPDQTMQMPDFVPGSMAAQYHSSARMGLPVRSTQYKRPELYR